MSKTVRLWNSGDADIDERMDRCLQAYNYRPHLIAAELKLLRDENRALIRELSEKEEQLMKLANALSTDETAIVVLQ